MAPLLLIFCLVLLGCGPTAARPRGEPMSSSPHSVHHDFDLVIRNGEVIDGTGAPGFRADVGIRGDTIAAVGDLSRASAGEVIEARGQVVAPGFIDLLGHSEGSVLIDPRLEGKVRQGVTTEVTGEGHSPGPIDEAMAAESDRTRPPGYPLVSWRTLGDFMRFVEKRGTAINFAFYVGAANPREIVLGKRNVQPTSEQMERMKAIVDQAMRDGAVGMSTALIYVPGVFAPTSELVELSKVVAKYGGGYFTHLRNEADGIDAALDEAFAIGRQAEIGVNIFHLKVGGKQNWGRMKEVVQKIGKERAGGRDVAANVYPYTATATDLTALAPNWALEGGYDAFLERLRSDAIRKQIADEIRASGFYQRIGGAHGILIRRVPDPTFAHFEKKRLDEIAGEMHLEPVDAAIALFRSSTSSPTAIYFSMSEEDVKTALCQPWVAIGSDSGAVVGSMVSEGAHPRAYGTFPRVLGHYVRDEKLFTLEEAVRKMTSLAASRVHFADRGRIARGMKADLVVFDPARIADVATYEDPHHYSVGISDVVINGVAVLREGKMTGALPGRILRRGRQ
jgi:N-acyl-D-amino-acid deacylase